jgi:hypothetical protein
MPHRRPVPDRRVRGFRVVVLDELDHQVVQVLPLPHTMKRSGHSTRRGQDPKQAEEGAVGHRWLYAAADAHLGRDIAAHAPTAFMRAPRLSNSGIEAIMAAQNGMQRLETAPKGEGVWLVCPRCQCRRAHPYPVRAGWRCRKCAGIAYGGSE